MVFPFCISLHERHLRDRLCTRMINHSITITKMSSVLGLNPPGGLCLRLRLATSEFRGGLRVTEADVHTPVLTVGPPCTPPVYGPPEPDTAVTPIPPSASPAARRPNNQRRRSGRSSVAVTAIHAHSSLCARFASNVWYRCVLGVSVGKRYRVIYGTLSIYCKRYKVIYGTRSIYCVG